MKTLKVALAGFGAGGQIYNAPIISSVEGFEVSKILTSSEENIKVAKRTYPQAEISNDYGKILADQEIDLVVITTPNHLHFEYARKALKAGKHVVVEKPFTPTVKEAEELIGLAKEHSRVLSVNHNRRWDSDILTIQKLIEQGKLGHIVEFEAHFDRFRNYVKEGWKERREVAGSGILYDLGSHLIDQALVLFGMPKEVFANLRTQRENSEVFDNFELLLFYPGLKVSLKAGMLVKIPGPRYSLLGRKGSFVKHGMDVQEEALKRGELPKDHPGWGKETKDLWGKLHIEGEETFIESETGDYRHFYRNIYNSILGKEELKVTPEDAMKVIQIIELAQQSHREKRILSVEG